MNLYAILRLVFSCFRVSSLCVLQARSFLRNNAERHAKSSGVSLQPAAQVMQQVQLPAPGTRVTAEEVEKVNHGGLVLPCCR